MRMSISWMRIHKFRTFRRLIIHLRQRSMALYLMIRRYVFEFIISSCWKVWLVGQCERCERSNRECAREETQDHGTRCTQCIILKKGCSLTSLEGESRIKVTPNDPKVRLYHFFLLEKLDCGLVRSLWTVKQGVCSWRISGPWYKMHVLYQIKVWVQFDELGRPVDDQIYT